MCVCAEETHLSPGQATQAHGSFPPCRCHTVIFFCWWQYESCLGGDSPGGEASQGGVTACYHQFPVEQVLYFTQHLVYVPWQPPPGPTWSLQSKKSNIRRSVARLAEGRLEDLCLLSLQLVLEQSEGSWNSPHVGWQED